MSWFRVVCDINVLWVLNYKVVKNDFLKSNSQKVCEVFPESELQGKLQGEGSSRVWAKSLVQLASLTLYKYLTQTEFTLLTISERLKCYF